MPTDIKECVIITHTQKKRFCELILSLEYTDFILKDSVLRTTNTLNIYNRHEHIRTL